MVRIGLLGLACALTAALALSALHAAPPEDRDQTISATLAVQTAMQQGREHLLRGDSKSAVYVLEAQLARINGNAAYLALLRDAYRAYTRELRIANQEAEAEVYQRRLRILDPGADLDVVKSRGANSPSQPVAAADTKPAPTQSVPAPTPKIRAVSGEETGNPKTGTLVARAEEAFNNRRFTEACQLYGQAYQADQTSTRESQDRWAYCKLYSVVERLNQSGSDSASLADLEKEVNHALTLAPKLEYGKFLLSEIQKRRDPGKTVARDSKEEASSPAVALRHFERDTQGWARVETTNFRVLHNQSRDMAEKTAQIAEQTRGAMFQKWFGSSSEWKPRCDIFLHSTAQDYSKATGAPATSPGHSSIRSEGGRVVARRIDLHCDDANMLIAVLPHEATHVVVAGQYGEHPVPRWADEGMAVLTEPRDKIDRHTRNLPRCQRDGQLMHVRQLLQLQDYPDPHYITGFYAQSVSVVEFLASRKGPQAFTQFLRDALRTGYEKALNAHYGFRGFDDLQQQWTRSVFGDNLTSAENTRGYR